MGLIFILNRFVDCPISPKTTPRCQKEKLTGVLSSSQRWMPGLGEPARSARRGAFGTPRRRYT
eukprot:775089-Pyramimonas_sp.AAC.1